MLSLSISYPYLVKFDDFVDNNNNPWGGWSIKMRGETQAQQGMTLRITLIELYNTISSFNTSQKNAIFQKSSYKDIDLYYGGGQMP
jgi:hypothetical protein